MEKIEKLFKKINLSDGEIKVFLTLLRGPITASQLAKETKLNRANIYKILEKLKSKKLIYNYKEKNKTFFRISRLKRVEELFEEKIEELQKEKEKWIKIKKEIKSKPLEDEFSLEIYEGLEEMKEVLNNIIKLKKTVYAFGYEGLFEEFFGNWWIDFIKERAKRGIKFKGIFNWHETAGKFYMPPLTEIRYIDFKKIGKIEIAFTDEYVWIFSFEKKPKVILIKSHIVAKGLKSYFDFIWNKAKRIK